MGTLVTEYIRLAREFRLFGVEREATAGLLRSNDKSARAQRQATLLQQLVTVIYQTLALTFIICAFAVIAGHPAHDLGAIAAVLLLILRSLFYAAAAQGSFQTIRAVEDSSTLLPKS